MPSSLTAGDLATLRSQLDEFARELGFDQVGVAGIEATPICSQSVWPLAPCPGPPTPIQPATCPAATVDAAVGVIVARMP